MRMSPDEIRSGQIERLRKLDEVVQSIRDELKLNNVNELIWEAIFDFDEKIIVEADGYGGATVSRRQDLGGCSYLNHYSEHFDTIDLAIKKAVELLGDPVLIEDNDDRETVCG